MLIQHYWSFIQFDGGKNAVNVLDSREGDRFVRFFYSLWTIQCEVHIVHNNVALGINKNKTHKEM